ncbi:retrovirus-related pol polyprotein from transposon TNT 1-94 [Tanacetum coccineum]
MSIVRQRAKLGSSKKAKIVESKNANNSEPNHTWGSNAIDFPSSSSLVNDRLSRLFSVRFRNDQIEKIMGYGDYQLGNIIMSRNLEGVVLLSGSRDTNLYTISLDDMLNTSPICLLSKASKTKSWLWHRWLSHLNFGTLNKLAKDSLARGIPKLKFQKDHLCSACASKKSKKSSHHPKAEDTNQEKLYLLHMDLRGPIRVASINGKTYILMIVNDYSRFTWVRFLRTKDEAPEAIIKCIKNIQVRLNATVRNVRTDNETEFINQTLREFYENVGITHETSVARTPQQNDIVERRNQTLIEVARTMLIFSKASLFLWAESINNPKSEDLGKLDAKADIRPRLKSMTPATSSSGLVSNPVSQQPFLVAAALRAAVLADSPVSTSIDQDAPSSSIPSTQEQEHSLIISQDFKESPKTPLFYDDPLHESLHKDSTSQGSSSNVRPTHTPFEHLGRWTRDHPIANVIRDPSRSVSTRKQLETDAMLLDNPSHVYKLKKALYGLKQAPRAWYDMLSSFLISQHFSKCAVDPTLFTQKAGNDLLLVQIYVDDIIFAFTNTAMCNKFANQMSTNDSVDTPMVEKSKLDEDLQGKPVDATLYRDMIGSLDTGMSLTAYADANHAGCQDTRRSTPGSARFLCDKLVSWSSKKQKCTAISSTEAEYIALSGRFSSYCDNKSAIALCCNNVQHSRAKHIDVRYHFIKEQVENGIISLLDRKAWYEKHVFENVKTSGRGNRRVMVREPTFQVVLDALALTPCYSAFLITADVPEVYMHQFWDSVYKHDTFYRFKIDKRKRFKLTLEIFRNIFKICPKVQVQDFDALPTDEEIVSFLRELGHTREINSLNDVVVDQMHLPWRTFAALINKSLSGKTTGLDKIRLSRA